MYVFYKGVWVLPVAGFGVGYVTNWVALKLIFEPAKPVNLGCYTVQGLFLKRQQEAAAAMASMSKHTFIAQPALWREVFTGAWHDRWERLLRDTVEAFVRKKLAAGPLRRMLGAVLLGEARLQRIVSQVRFAASFFTTTTCRSVR